MNEKRQNGGEGAIRVQKYIAECGLMSRRAAENEIAAGNIHINGRPASIGDRIVPGVDEVRFLGAVIGAERRAVKKVYLMLNKPTGYVTTLSDERGRRTVAELVASVGVRVYPVGRLDCMSEGLLLMTNDGELTNKLTHPSHEIPKIYEVAVFGEVEEEQLSTLRSALVLGGYRIRPVKVEILRQNERGTLLRFELYEGRNRQIRRMCEEAELKIRKLKRVAIGQLTLGELKVGEYRMLTDEEVRYLKGEK